MSALRLRPLALVPVAALAALAAGCRPGTAEVAGRVTLGGKPVSGGSVIM